MPLLLDERALHTEAARICAGRPIPPACDCSCNISDEEGRIAALLQWAAAIAQSFGVTLTSVEEGFADGRLLCLLV